MAANDDDHVASPTPTTTAIPYLPTDLILHQIVPRLPVKSILKFMIVSKSWLSFISDESMEKRASQFSRMTQLVYPQIYPNNGVVKSLFRCISVEKNTYESRCSTHPTSTNFGITADPAPICPDKPTPILSDICNGLILMLHVKYGDERQRYEVYNPATRSSFVLPPAPNAFKSGYDAYFTLLEYDPKVSRHFKVIWILSNPDELKFMMAIFTSENGDWCISNEINTSRALPYHHRLGLKPALLYGAIYMMIPSTHDLIQLDFTKETIHEIKLPRGGKADSSSCIGVSMGFLYYALVCEDQQLRVWMLQDFATEKWVLRHTVLVKDFVSKCGGEIPCFQGLLCSSCFHPDEEAIYAVVGSSIFCYEMSLGLMKCILHHSSQIPLSPHGRITTYSPCLVNLKWYDLDDTRRKRLLKKQCCFRKLGSN